MCVFPAIVKMRLIPPLFTDKRLSKLPELIIKSRGSGGLALSANRSVCAAVCLFTVKPSHNCRVVQHCFHTKHALVLAGSNELDGEEKDTDGERMQSSVSSGLLVSEGLQSQEM